jgi:translocation and assembly module TamA
MVYSFYDPHHETRGGLGNYIILDHILHAQRIGLPYVYLGYWVEGSARMQYKVRYRPMERLGRDGWHGFEPAEQARAIDRIVLAGAGSWPAGRETNPNWFPNWPEEAIRRSDILRASMMRWLAGLALAPLPLSPLLATPACAQSRNADAALEALIPDSALDNPDAWALDTDAARTKAPDVTALISPDPLPPLPPMPGITLDWPDAAELPPIEPLTPDADIADLQQQAREAGAALDADDLAQPARIADAAIVRVGKRVILAFPPEVNPDHPVMADRDAIVERFRGLSALGTLADGEDNLAQLTRRAKNDAELLQQILRVYGYYDPDVTQSIERPASPEAASAPAGATPGPAAQAAPAPAAADSPSAPSSASAPIPASAATSTSAPSRQAESAEATRARRAAQLAGTVVRFDIQPGPQYTYAHITLGDVAAAREAAPCARRSTSGWAIRSIRTRS